MIHNLTAKPFKVSITYDVDFVPDDDAPARRHEGRPPDLARRAERQASTRCSTCSRAAAPNGKFTYPDEATDPYAAGIRSNEWTVDQDGVLVKRSGTSTPAGSTTLHR